MGEICCKPEKTKKTINDRDFLIDIPEDSKLKKLNQIKLEVNYCKNEEKIENIKDDVAFAVTLDATDIRALKSQNLDDIFFLLFSTNF